MKGLAKKVTEETKEFLFGKKTREHAIEQELFIKEFYPSDQIRNSLYENSIPKYVLPYTQSMLTVFSAGALASEFTEYVESGGLKMYATLATTKTLLYVGGRVYQGIYQKIRDMFKQSTQGEHPEEEPSVQDRHSEFDLEGEEWKLGTNYPLSKDL